MRRHPLSVAGLVPLVLAAVLAAPAPAAAADLPVLTQVRAAEHEGYDRIVFEFDGPLPSRASARWVDEVRPFPGAAPYAVHGEATIEVRFAGVVANRSRPGFEWVTTYREPERAFGLPNLNHMVSTGAVDGQMAVALGTMQRTRILRAFTLTRPSRYVVDVDNDFERTLAPLWFVDDNARSLGGHQPATGPIVVPRVHWVVRSVPMPAVARGQLHRFFAGPTPEEAAKGLLLITSTWRPHDPRVADRTGFADLRITDRTAHVRLTGRCFPQRTRDTVAIQLLPTLKHWPRVDSVMLYDEQGRTQDPHGPGDSIPEWMEPEPVPGRTSTCPPL